MPRRPRPTPPNQPGQSVSPTRCLRPAAPLPSPDRLRSHRDVPSPRRTHRASCTHPRDSCSCDFLGWVGLEGFGRHHCKGGALLMALEEFRSDRERGGLDRRDQSQPLSRPSTQNIPRSASDSRWHTRNGLSGTVLNLRGQQTEHARVAAARRSPSAMSKACRLRGSLEMARGRNEQAGAAFSRALEHSSTVPEPFDRRWRRRPSAPSCVGKASCRRRWSSWRRPERASSVWAPAPSSRAVTGNWRLADRFPADAVRWTPAASLRRRCR